MARSTLGVRRMWFRQFFSLCWPRPAPGTTNLCLFIAFQHGADWHCRLMRVHFLSEGDFQRETDDGVNRNQITAYFHTRPININDALPLNLEYRCCRQWTEHISRLVRLWQKWLCDVCRHQTQSLNTNNIDLTNLLPPPGVLCFTRRLYLCLSLSNFK